MVAFPAGGSPSNTHPRSHISGHSSASSACMWGRLCGCLHRASSGAIFLPSARSGARGARAARYKFDLLRTAPFDPPPSPSGAPWSRTSPRGTLRTSATGAPASMAGGEDPLIQYIIVREDLWKEQGWSLGSVMAQGCHAAVAAVWESKGAATTGAYCSPANIDSMRKVGSGAFEVHRVQGLIVWSRKGALFCRQWTMCCYFVRRLKEPGPFAKRC